MLPDEKIAEVKRLLALGTHSQRAVSKATGVSRIVVYRIATGKRRVKPKSPKEEWDVDRSGRPFERCPICGSKVQMPCTACLTRKVLTKAEFSTIPDSKSHSFELQLEEEHRLRYEQVRAWRESQQNPNFTEIPENWPFRKRFRTKTPV